MVRAVALNTLAFAILIGLQHIIIFPMLSRLVTLQAFSTAVLLITISTVTVNVLGGEASNIALLRSGTYSDRGLPWDSPRLVAFGMIFVTIGTAVSAPFHDVDSILIAQALATTLLGMVRSLALAPDKYANKFHLVLSVHFGYAVGALLGLTSVQSTGWTLLPFLVGEVFGLLIILVVRRAHQDVQLTLRRTEEYHTTRRRFMQLALVALLMNSVSYLDRLMIVPVLGATALGIYYSASALAKALSMVTNPVANTMLARLGALGDEGASQVCRRAFRVSVCAWGIFAASSLLVSVLGLKLLYPMFFVDAVSILVPVSVASASAAASDLLRPVALRFMPLWRFVAFNVVYAVTFLTTILVFSHEWGLAGFAWAGAIARTGLFCLFLCQAYVISRKAQCSE